eukprot:4903160-Alexandrium_andersonii.AAC.1
MRNATPSSAPTIESSRAGSRTRSSVPIGIFGQLAASPCAMARSAKRTTLGKRSSKAVPRWG